MDFIKTGIKKSFVILFAMCVAVFVAAVPVSAQDDGDAGYDSPYFQADFTQDLNSWTSALINPALLFRVDQMHASMAFYRWGLNNIGDAGGNMGYQDFSLLYPYRYRHTFGLTLLHARNSVDQFDVVRGPDGPTIVPGEALTYQDLWVIGNYGVKVLPWFWAGANVKMRTQVQFNESSFSRVPGLDVGVYFNVFDHYRWGDLGVSLVAQDLLPTQTPWEANVLEGVSAGGGLINVSRGRAGLRYSGLNDNLVVSTEMIVDNAFRDIFANVGWNEFLKAVESGGSTREVKDNISDLFPVAFRWGFHAKYLFIPQIWLKAGWTNNNIPYLGFNYNFIYPLPEMINYFNIDYHIGYSWIERGADMNDERGLVMMIKGSADFGRTREQKESRRLYDKLVVAPMDAYQEAMRLYTAGKYWEAAFAYGKLISLYPTFYLNDKAVYFMGDCYKYMYMNNTARETFREALDEYTTSDMRAFYLYGIMALDYREESYDEAMRNHAFIINLYPDSEIRGEAEYLAGEIEFMRGNMDVAKAHFEAVKPTDPSYLYAQYTLAIINYETDRHEAAIQNLKVIINDTTTRAADAHLQNAAAVKLGHVYFEAGDKLRDAVTSYMLVKDDAKPHGDEALLGIAWSWIKAGQPQQAMQRVDRLIQAHPESPFVPEAHLLRGYILMLQKNYTAAIPAFERSIELATNNKFLKDEDVKRRKVKNDAAQEEFGPTADKIRRNALRKPTPRSVEERPELYTEYEKFDKENREFFHYKLVAKSHNNFFMREEEIIEDATFALAKTTSLVKTRRQASELEGMRGTGEQLDTEIERLRRELEGSESVGDDGADE